MKTFLFHLGFGLPFLIPIANVLLLSFAPVGATLYHADNRIKFDKKNEKQPTGPRIGTGMV